MKKGSKKLILSQKIKESLGQLKSVLFLGGKILTKNTCLYLSPTIPLWLLLVVMPTEIHPAIRQWGGDGEAFVAAFSQYIEVARRENGETYLKLSRKGYTTPPEERYEELHFTFEHPDALGARFPGVRLIEARYKTRRFNDSVGQAASFETPSHKLQFTIPQQLFAAEKAGMQDFSIFFLLRPYQLKQKMTVLRKIGILEGKRYGFETAIKEGHLSIAFHGIFRDSRGSSSDFVLTTRDSLSTSAFRSILLTYEAGAAKLTLYMDGREQAVTYTTENRRPEGTRLIAKAHPYDHSPVIIGGGYSGALDELILRNGLLSPEHSPARYPGEIKFATVMKQTPGVFLSEVFDLGFSASEILQVKFWAEEPEATRVRLSLRIADKPFKADTNEFLLPFENIRGKKFTGRFFQFKAELFSDPAGVTSPTLLQVSIESRENPPPQAPRGLQIAAVTAESVTLNFLRNPELDVINGGRYHIYYGLQPYEPLGVIRYRKVSTSPFGTTAETINEQNSRLITQDLRLQNRIQVTITNEMISDNIIYSRNKPDLLFPYPLLQKDVPYYFWVTACDSAYSEAPEYRDHESAASAAVAARPE